MKKLLLAVGVMVTFVFIASTAPAPAATSDDEVALVNPASGQWHLRDPDGGVRTFFFGNGGDTPLMGDWDCDGVDTPGMFRPTSGLVYLTNTNPASGVIPQTDVSFFLGGAGDRAVAGDFNGDGCDTLAVYRFGKVYIRNVLSTGPAQWVYFFGKNSDQPFAGDFDGDGVDTVGVFRTNTGLVYYSNENPPSPENAPLAAATANQFFFGLGSDRFFPGNWNGDGTDTVGIFRPSDTTVYLRNSNTTGPADASFPFGATSWKPVSGDFEQRTASLTPNTTSVDMGPVGLRTTSNRFDIVLNYTSGGGDAPLFITEVNVAGAHPGQFIVNPPADLNIGPGETRKVRVKLQPTTVGVKRARVKIHHTGVNSPLIVDLTGAAGYRVNAGGEAVGPWEADNPLYGPGGSVGPVSTESVSGPTAPNGVFENYRFGAQAWNFPVVPGAYQVNLYFAETFPGTQSVGARRFDVAIEGETVLTDFDIFAAAGGGYTGIVRSFDIVSDSTLNVDFSVLVNSPAIQGIEIVPTPAWKVLGASPGAAEFGSIAVGGTQQRTIKIVHLGEPGTASVSTSPMTLVGPGADQFRFISGSGARTLAPGDVAQVIVEYAPISDGSASASLQVSHSGRESPVLVPLSGSADDVTLYRINNGGDALGGAVPWVPDEPFLVAGSPRGETSTATAIDTSDPSIPTGTRVAMLRTEAFGSSSLPLAYDLPIPDGAYEIRLYFVEIVQNGPNQRFFDVRVEGALALNDLDVYAEAGGKFKAVMIPVQTNVAGGVLDIDFIPQPGGNLPIIHGIEVVTKVGQPVIESSPVSLTFGPVLSGGTETSDVSIVNAGAADSPSLVIEAATITGPNKARFALLTDLTGAVPPGNETTASIRFTSSGAADKQATLLITYNNGKNFEVELSGLVNDPPVLGVIPNRTVAEGSPMVSLNPAAIDLNGDTLAYSQTGLPGWATLVDNGDGTAQITGTPGFTDAGSSVVTLTVTDDGGLTDSDTFSITVNNTNRPPVFNQNLVGRTDSEGDTVNISAEATDPDGDTLLWSATGLPPGVTIDSDSGLISGTLSATAAAGSPYSTAISVSDGIGGTDLDTFAWTVNESFTLSVVPAGAGSGTVTSAPAGISCGLVCDAEFTSGSFVTLTATPAAGSVFTGWSGAGCGPAGTDPCVVEMTSAKLTFATFELDTFDLTALRAGTGGGNFTFSPTGVSCGPDCRTYDFGTVVTLTPFPLVGSTFTGWSGAGCAAFGTDPCVMTMTSDLTPTATFTLDTFDLTALRAGSGGGNFTFSPTGTSCGADCMTYASGTVVTLSPFPLAGSTFIGWSGAGCASFGTSPCVMTMNSDLTPTATFDLIPPTTFDLTVATVGSGSVGVAPPGTPCGAGCSTHVDGTLVTLTPSPGVGFMFDNWNGAGCAAFGTSPCEVTVDADKSTTATFTLIPPTTFDLTVAAPVNGSIGVAPAGVSCGAGCSTHVEGTVVTLTPTPDVGFEVGVWSSCDDVQLDDTCEMTMDADKGPVSVTFTLIPPTTFDLTVAAPVNGSIGVAPAGVSCGAGCSTHVEGTVVTLTPTPDAGFVFESWAGCDDVQLDDTCEMTMDADKGPVSGSFNAIPTAIALDSTTVDEGLAIGALVGVLSVTDPDGPSASYTFASGAGDDDNLSFTIGGVGGDELLTAEVFDFLIKDTYLIRVGVDDGAGGIFEMAFTITINDV